MLVRLITIDPAARPLIEAVAGVPWHRAAPPPRSMPPPPHTRVPAEHPWLRDVVPRHLAVAPDAPAAAVAPPPPPTPIHAGAHAAAAGDAAMPGRPAGFSDFRDLGWIPGRSGAGASSGGGTRVQLPNTWRVIHDRRRGRWGERHRGRGPRGRHRAYDGGDGGRADS